MIYVFDTNSLSVFNNYYPATFPKLWERLDMLADEGTITSVSEVLRELENDNRSTFIQQWAKNHKSVFAKPSNEELLVVQQILAIPHFQVLISNKAILKGTPVADPFVVAAAKVKGATVVTEEALKPNAAKIPNVCGHFGVKCIDLEIFMSDEGWTF